MYDDKGNCTELIHKPYESKENISDDNDDKDYTSTSKYEYDKNSNWIKQIEFMNGVPLYILEREIEYYKET